MKADINKNGDVTVRYNVIHNKLLSPDGTQHLIPCETCRSILWVALNVVSIVCDRCVYVTRSWAEAYAKQYHCSWCGKDMPIEQYNEHEVACKIAHLNKSRQQVADKLRDHLK